MAERTSAKRLYGRFSYAPVRRPNSAGTFSHRGCDTPLLLCAVYFAKLFGVDDKLDISPFFETSTALEREQLISKLG